jgi:LysM repeat protein
MDEEKEPHFLAGKSHVSAMDYKGAIDSFEKALEVNPKSASAHFELAWICDQKESDPAAAIYHYGHYLKLRPRADNAETVRNRILACKQDLARSVSWGPATPSMQKELERLIEENKGLREELANLRQQQTSTNQSVGGPPARVAQNPDAPLTAGGARDATPPNMTRPAPARPLHTHMVKTGETLTLIARNYGVKLETLMAANPGLEPRRLRTGQTINLPSP